MKNIITLVLLSILLFGCSSAPVKPEDTSLRFSSPALKLTLQQALQYEQYPDQAALSELVRSKLQAALKEKGQLADSNNPDALSISISMHYQRTFAGEATPIPSSSVGPPRVNYTVTMSRDGKPVTTFERSNMTVNRGLAKNLMTLFTFYLGNTPETEAEDIAILTRGIANELAQQAIAR